MRRTLRTTASLLAVLLALPTLAGGLPPGDPAAHGVSAERLARLDAVVRGLVSSGRIAGAVTLVARQGRTVHLGTYGMRDLEARLPMEPDTIFRIASQTKALTAVAAMVLVEEGRLLLGEPVSRFLPGLRRTTVAAAGDAAPVPARREITVRDLLTHTSGLSYGGDGPAAPGYAKAGLRGWYFADRPEPMSAVVERLAAVPFDAQPGERWIYGYGSDVLGVVVEKASGQTLDAFLKARLLDPLRMTDTHFYLPAEKKGRLATVYGYQDGRLERAPQGRAGQGDYVDGPRAAFSGGAGLLSTAGDYARFLQMLLAGGELEGVRVLAPSTVAQMTADQVGPLYPNPGLGFGLGFEVVVDPGRAGMVGSPGTYGWGGAYYSSYFVDPSEQLVGVLLVQLLPDGGLDLKRRFRNLVYQALVGPVGPRTR